MEEAVERPVKVSYIDEMNAFQEQAAELGLSASERVLWLALLYLDNRSHWTVWFNVPAVLLSRYTGLSPATIRRTRKSLVEHGLLRVKIRNGSQAALYQLALHDEQIPNVLPAHDERQPAHSERQMPKLPAHDERQGAHSERVDNHSERQPAHDERQPAHSERIHRLDKTLLRHRQGGGSENDPQSAPAGNENGNPKIPSLQDEVVDLGVRLGWGVRLTRKFTAWAEMCESIGRPQRGPRLERAAKELMAVSRDNKDRMEALLTVSTTKGWIHFYEDTRQKTGGRQASTQSQATLDDNENIPF